MAGGVPGARKEPLHVVAMALALTLAAFAGGAAGLVWQSASFGDDATEAEAGSEPDGDAAGEVGAAGDRADGERDDA